MYIRYKIYAKKSIVKIAVLQPERTNSLSEISKYEPVVDPLPFLRDHIVQVISLSKNESEVSLLQKLGGYDCYINLCDGAADDDRAGIEVVHFLEKYRLPFTGASSSFYDPLRSEMKRAAVVCKVNVPAAFYAKRVDDISHTWNIFPCIVKHPQSYSSIGLTKDSVVENSIQLKKQVQIKIEKFGGALIEEYIKGREFTVLVVSVDKEKVVAFDAAEIIFPEGEHFKHFELKWLHHRAMKYKKADTETLNNVLKMISINIFKQMQGNGYARFDYRIDKNGEIYFLELNPNCSVYYPESDRSSADEILKFYPHGHDLFTEYILTYAMQRFI